MLEVNNSTSPPHLKHEDAWYDGVPDGGALNVFYWASLDELYTGSGSH